MAPLARIAVFFATAGLFALPSVARAEPDNACEGKNAGDSCGIMKIAKPADGPMTRTTVPGVCKADECCDLDYSKGSPPETVCHPCLTCKEGAPSVGNAPGDEPSHGGPAQEPPRTTAVANSDGGPPATAPAEQRGCSVGAPPSAWAACLPLLLMLGWTRRR